MTTALFISAFFFAVAAMCESLARAEDADRARAERHDDGGTRCR